MKPNPWSNRLPEGVSEADLLDWIEADARTRANPAPGSALDRVARAVATDARLGAALDAMRVDRAALGSLETPAPPQWVTQAILEEHERQALLALSDMAAMGPRATSDEDEAFTFSSMPRWFKPALAAAALVALAFGAWQLYPLVLPGPSAQSGPQLAAQDPSNEPITPHNDPPETASGPVVAVAPVEDLPPAPIPTPRAIQPTPEEMLAARLDMPVEQALEMALAGRLLLVVDVDDAHGARTTAEAVVARPIETTWRLEPARGPLLAALASPDHARVTGLDGIGEGVLTANDRGPLGQLEMVLASTPTVYLAQASASPQAVLALLDALTIMGGPVRGIVLPEPLPAAGEMATPPPAIALLWWQQDPASWHPWAAIPVRFVERP